MNRLAGAGLRAFLVVLMIATPSLILPGTTPDVGQVVMLVALFGAALTFFEYSATYPGLIEFRDAPPFNRIRFISLFFTILLLSLLTKSALEPTVFPGIVSWMGCLLYTSDAADD